MTFPGASLLHPDPDEDRALTEMEWPRFIDVGAPLLGLALTAAVAAAAFAPGDGDGADPVAVTLVVASALPWLLWIISPDAAVEPELRNVWYRRLFNIEVVLVLVAALYVAGWIADVSLGRPVAYQLLQFSVFLVVALRIVGRPRRTAGLVVIGGLCVHVIGINQWASRASGFDWTGVVAQTVGLGFTFLAAVAVRQGVLAIHRGGEALAQQATADERRRVARDVHDVVAHSLAITMLQMTAARMAIGRGETGEATEALEEAERHGRASLADVRRVVGLLRADDGAAVDAPQPELADIDALVDGYRAAGLQVEQTVAGEFDQVSPAAALALYRALQEALANATRHGCGRATVDLRIADDAVRLNVDNRLATNASGGSPGSGLLGMRERLEAAGGVVVAGREDDRWVVRARVPLAPERVAPSHSGPSTSADESATKTAIGPGPPGPADWGGEFSA